MSNHEEENPLPYHHWHQRVQEGHWVQELPEE